jgi:hypothetical protein
MNILISLGLIRPEASLMSSAFFQWLNQTYNAGVNWHNRGGGEEASMEKLGRSYLAATGAALLIGVGAMPLLRRLGLSGQLVQLTVPMVAVSVSSVVNLILTRQDELVAGVAVYTEDGHPLGMSQAAGQMALAQCSAARVLWTFCVLTAAPLLNRGILGAVPSIAKSASASMAMQASVIFVSLWLSVPLCMAIWPQRASASVESLEPELRQARHPLTGAPVEQVFFNKGL